MITRKLSIRDLIQGTRKFFSMKAGRTLFSANLEVTRRCNLRCNFCPYWRQTGQEDRLADYTPVVSRLDPLSLSITGGEPLLRDDLERVIHRLRRGTRFVYMNLITNGALLTVQRARSLWTAGLNQITVSLDFPDDRHDRFRGTKGLWRHLQELLPRLAATEIDNLCLNTVIMKENMDDLLKIAAMARGWQFNVSFSTYNPNKAGNRDHLVAPDRLVRLQQVLTDVMAWKRRYRNITNSNFYLRNVSRYFRDGSIPGCLAGRKWVQIGPDGTLSRCSDRETLEGWETFNPRRVPLTDCRQCWYACRGEAEAPLGLKRIVELNR